MDNVIDNTKYPLAKQKMEAESKRRMGLGITGLGNALTLIDLKYGSLNARNFIKKIHSNVCTYLKLILWRRIRKSHLIMSILKRSATLVVILEAF